MQSWQVKVCTDPLLREKKYIYNNPGGDWNPGWVGISKLYPDLCDGSD